MPNKIFFVCLFVSLFCAGASLSCRWMEQNFRQYNENSLTLLENMVTNSTNSTVDAAEEDAVAFPDELYKHASKASAEDRLAFTVQILEEVAALFEEDRSPSNETVWEETTVENFINLTTQQADGLRSCVTSVHFYYLRQGGYVFARVCLFVCLSVSVQHNSKSYGQIWMKFSGFFGNGIRKKLLNFGGDRGWGGPRGGPISNKPENFSKICP
uniref:Interferon a3-like n=1 Tax=Sphaeramia orbicularis TaxID=375764 RepID=A0A673ADI1_9TELE